MLQIFATMFFSMAALAATAMIWAALADNRRDIGRALGLGTRFGMRGAAPPRLAPARISRARPLGPAAMPGRPLRAAA